MAESVAVAQVDTSANSNSNSGTAVNVAPDIVDQAIAESVLYPADIPEDIKDLYDAQKGAIDYNKFLDYKKYQEEQLGATKQYADKMRGVISNKLTPITPNDVNNFQLNDMQMETIKSNPLAAQLVGNFANEALNSGFTKGQFKNGLETILNTIPKGEVRDEQKEQLELQQLYANEKAKLGKEADTIIKESLDFIQSNTYFNNEEREAMLKIFEGEGSGERVRALHKIATRFSVSPVKVPGTQYQQYNTATATSKDDYMKELEGAGFDTNKRLAVHEKFQSMGVKL
jgi:hypothetical protein